ncbi:MAG: pyrroline-5-carboxylate reductase [Bacteroidales bacterium]|jgi:pyrroline-5-carboxylate reductase|nr:pyrroline-5-carboxylate reductase [Bacteroidales bacterium]
MTIQKIAVIGAGNMGGAIVRGILQSGWRSAAALAVSDPSESVRATFLQLGVTALSDNVAAVRTADTVIVAVKPWLLEAVMREISPALRKEQIFISIVAGVSLQQLSEYAGIAGMPVFRVIPNTSIAVLESMTCIATKTPERLAEVQEMFAQLGKAAVIGEEQMAAATVLGSCGTAYALRYLRAAMEGGIEMGFSAQLAKEIAAQTIRGAMRLLESGGHPEQEIDKVTTPKGITIVGLNEMERHGFSAAVIQGLLHAFKKMS